MSDFVNRLIKEVFDQNKINVFYEENNINPDKLKYIGAGDFGKAYSTGDGRVLKITSSPGEYSVACDLLFKHYEGIVEYYAAEQMDRRTYYILMEEAEHDSLIEDSYYTLMEIADELGDTMLYPEDLDIERYEQETGNKINDHVKTFAKELAVILNSERMAGIQVGDVRADNLGRNKNGKLVAFDMDDKRRRS